MIGASTIKDQRKVVREQVRFMTSGELTENIQFYRNLVGTAEAVDRLEVSYLDELVREANRRGLVVFEEEVEAD